MPKFAPVLKVESRRRSYLVTLTSPVSYPSVSHLPSHTLQLFSINTANRLVSMEALLQQSRAMCPFLKRSSPTTLRSLATATRPSASPGGGTMSNLQRLARRCPVMSKALAVQSARMTGGKRFTSSAAGVPTPAKSTRTTAGKRALHSTGGNGANMTTEFHKDAQRGMFWPNESIAEFQVLIQDSLSAPDLL
jgi:hypothetical protein